MLQLGQVATLLNWLEMLPDELVRSRPELCIFYAWVLLSKGEWDSIEPRLRDAEYRLSEVEELLRSQIILSSVAYARAAIAYLQGNASRAIEFALKALEHLSENDLTLRGVVTLCLGSAYWLYGDIEMANQALTIASTINQAAGNTFATLNALSLKARLQIIQGHLHKAYESHQQVMGLILGQSGQSLPPAASSIYVGMSELLYEWNELDTAIFHLKQGIKLAERGGIIGALLFGYIILARVKQAQGDRDAAMALLQKLIQLLQTHKFPQLLSEVMAYRVRFWISQENVEAMSHWARECGLSVDDAPNHLRRSEQLTFVRVLIAQGKVEEALTMLERQLPLVEAAEHIGSLIEMLVLKALALQAQNNTTQALAALERSLVLAAPEGYIRIFIDEGPVMATLLSALLEAQLEEGSAPSQNTLLNFIHRLLMALGVDTKLGPKVVHSLVKSLSDRELEVLRLLPTGMSNQEIAQELVVAISTLKTHINNIYYKLNVRSRIQAIARARELGLL